MRGGLISPIQFGTYMYFGSVDGFYCRSGNCGSWFWDVQAMVLQREKRWVPGWAARRLGEGMRMLWLCGGREGRIALSVLGILIVVKEFSRFQPLGRLSLSCLPTGSGWWSLHAIGLCWDVEMGFRCYSRS